MGLPQACVLQNLSNGSHPAPWPTVVKLRLQNGSGTGRGRLEVYHNGQWGMVRPAWLTLRLYSLLWAPFALYVLSAPLFLAQVGMDAYPIRARQSVETVDFSTGWTDYDDTVADVACRQLGFPLGGSAIEATAAGYGDTGGPIWTGRVVCKGDEAGLEYCSHDPLKNYRPLLGPEPPIVGLVCMDW